MSYVIIRQGVGFRDDAAASFARYEARIGRAADVNRTTVDYATQMDLHRDYLAGRYPHLALHPDKSQHVYKATSNTGGVAWDTDERGPLLDEHGWVIVNEDEQWHREYQAARDQHRHEGWPASTTTTPTTTEEEDTDIMRLVFTKDNQGNLWTLVNTATGNIKQTRDQAQADRWAEVWCNSRVVQVASLQEALADLRALTA